MLITGSSSGIGQSRLMPANSFAIACFSARPAPLTPTCARVPAFGITRAVHSGFMSIRSMSESAPGSFVPGTTPYLANTTAVFPMSLLCSSCPGRSRCTEVSDTRSQAPSSTGVPTATFGRRLVSDASSLGAFFSSPTSGQSAKAVRPSTSTWRPCSCTRATAHRSSAASASWSEASFAGTAAPGQRSSSRPTMPSASKRFNVIWK
mmetsp:Transcript_151/g.395  ORF Transcript_151/g.395 Transcript_151/m.395 type:complete len:206 (-) Transcript_151:242-859(-)